MCWCIERESLLWTSFYIVYNSIFSVLYRITHAQQQHQRLEISIPWWLFRYTQHKHTHTAAQLFHITHSYIDVYRCIWVRAVWLELCWQASRISTSHSSIQTRYCCNLCIYSVVSHQFTCWPFNSGPDSLIFFFFFLRMFFSFWQRWGVNLLCTTSHYYYVLNIPYNIYIYVCIGDKSIARECA